MKWPYEALNIFHTGGSVVGVGVEILVLDLHTTCDTIYCNISYYITIRQLVACHIENIS